MKEPFVPYKLEEERDKLKLVFTVKLNTEERALLDKLKNRIEQPKDSTAIKQLAWVGAKVILSDSTAYLIDTLFKNKAKNKRLGIPDFE